MIKNVKWFFVVLVFSSLISLSFNRENVKTEKLSVGDTAPQFTLRDSVQMLNLHDTREGYTLLSFWASYDAESREKNTALAHLVKENNRVNMISVSFDRYASVFHATVKQDGLAPEDCFVETDGSNSEVFRLYDLKGGFSNYLINSRGVIVAKNVTTDELASFFP